MTQDEIDNLKIGDRIQSGCDIGTVVRLRSNFIYILFDDDEVYELIRGDYSHAKLLSNCFQLYKKEPKFKHVQRFVNYSDLTDIIELESPLANICDESYGSHNIPIIISFRAEDVE